MSVKITANDIIPCVYRFLLKYGFDGAAEALEEAAGSVTAKGGISSRKLMKICKYYLQHHPELQAKEEEEEEEEEEEVKPKSKKAAPANGKSTEVNAKRSKKVQEEDEEEEEEQPKTSKKVKTEVPAKKEKKDQGNKKNAAIEDFDEEEEEEQQPKIKTKSAADGLKNSKNGATNGYNNNQYMEEDDEEYGNNGYKNTTTVKRFSYVDPTLIDEIPEEFRDNTFEAKYRFGQGGDDFGAIGNEKLKDTRGKGFKKEKGKLKNKQFCGGGSRIDTSTVNSIKFRIDDD